MRNSIDWSKPNKKYIVEVKITNIDAQKFEFHNDTERKKFIDDLHKTIVGFEYITYEREV